MSLLQQIKDDQLTSRKNRESSEKISLLTTLIGEASMPGKNDGNRESTDAEVIAVIKKFIKNAEEVVSVGKPADDRTVQAQNEIDTLETYLPTQIAGAYLKVAIQQIILDNMLTGPRDMGKVMKVLKDNHAGLYDGKEASTIVKELLK